MTSGSISADENEPKGAIISSEEKQTKSGSMSAAENEPKGGTSHLQMKKRRRVAVCLLMK